MSPEPRVQMRVFYVGRGNTTMEQYRMCLENGWGGRWRSTLYLAWVEWRRTIDGELLYIQL